jgi:hypothetical protein
MIGHDFLKDQTKRLANNFNKNWFTEDRIKLIVQYIEQNGSTEPEVERVFTYFIEHDKSPSLGLIRHRLILEAQVSASRYTPKVEAKFCKACDETRILFVRHPEDNKYLVMACSFCRDHEDWNNFWDLPLYGPEFVRIDSPIKKAISQARDVLSLGSPVYTQLVRKLRRVCRESHQYFVVKGIYEQNI